MARGLHISSSCISLQTHIRPLWKENRPRRRFPSKLDNINRGKTQTNVHTHRGIQTHNPFAEQIRLLYNAMQHSPFRKITVNQRVKKNSTACIETKGSLPCLQKNRHCSLSSARSIHSHTSYFFKYSPTCLTLQRVLLSLGLLAKYLYAFVISSWDTQQGHSKACKPDVKHTQPHTSNGQIELFPWR